MATDLMETVKKKRGRPKKI
jgi:hypothetical protein